MAISDAKKKANQKWNAANADRYERINLLVPKGQKAVVEAAAKRAGESISQYMLKATIARMEGDKWSDRDKLY